jgi:predicted metal-dependent hydrolase
VKIDFKLVRSKRKTTALIVFPDGSLLVRAPMRASRKLIEEFVVSKVDWIEKQRSRLVTKSSKENPPSFGKKNKLVYLGESYPLEVKENNSRPLEFTGRKFILADPGNGKSAGLVENWYRQQARKYLSERISWFAQEYHLQPKKLRISSARTRWGSCSSKGIVSFTWRLMLAPAEVIDYVVVHELVHLVENNHQKPFWSKVAGILPDYKQYRLWLKKNGRELMEDPINC